MDELVGRTQQLEIGIEYKLDLKREDLEVLKELGSGNGGTVSKVRHIATGTIMARKVQTELISYLKRTMSHTTLTGHSRRSQERNTTPNRTGIAYHA